MNKKEFTKIVVLLLAVFCAASAEAFEANAIWLKGVVSLEERSKLDPTVNIERFEIGNDEPVTLYVTYRSLARDDKKHAAVSYRLNVVKPDGKLFGELIDPDTTLLGGSGVVPDEHAEDWGISHDHVVMGFSKEDARGIYIVKILIRDQISGEEVTKITEIDLK